jgi:16S rRNA (guanine527-N7)-methyltransferase
VTEEDAQQWIATRYGEQAQALDRLVQLVRAENDVQNLIAPSTVSQIWSRHIVDSAQLLAWGGPLGLWIDIGTGGGFPGLVIAILRPEPTLLIEPRKRRAEFLLQAADQLGLGDHVSVMASKVEHVTDHAAIISARAVAPVEKLLQAAQPCATTATRWLLPRGRIATDEIAQLKRRWTGVFHVEQSVTDPTSSILILDDVRRR